MVPTGLRVTPAASGQVDLVDGDQPVPDAVHQNLVGLIEDVRVAEPLVQSLELLRGGVGGGGHR
jgi:hypothetical protein